MRHRKEMNEFLSSTKDDVTAMRYKRLMLIACLDTFFNLPLLIVIVVTNITAGSQTAENYSYKNWRNVHDGAGGTAPGLSFSSIITVPASEWTNTGGWPIFEVKWSEWIYVLHALAFFSVFGTTPEMQRYYVSALWFIPERCGYRRQRVSEVQSISDVAFNSNPGVRGGRSIRDSRRSDLYNVESGIATANSTRSEGIAEGDDTGSATYHQQ